MNCQDFENLREEFLDGALSPGERAAVTEHLAQCPACTEALRQRQQLGERVAQGLQQSAQLQLAPEMKQRILREWSREVAEASQASKASAPSTAYWLAMCLRWAAAAVVVIAGVWTVGKFIGPRSTQTTAANAPASEVVIEMTYRTPVREFERDGDFVKDSFSFETVTVNTRLGSDHGPVSR